jgi:hypothetical protein
MSVCLSCARPSAPHYCLCLWQPTTHVEVMGQTTCGSYVNAEMLCAEHQRYAGLWVVAGEAGASLPCTHRATSTVGMDHAICIVNVMLQQQRQASPVLCSCMMSSVGISCTLLGRRMQDTVGQASYWSGWPAAHDSS